jgi:hypothetical protein
MARVIEVILDATSSQSTEKSGDLKGTKTGIPPFKVIAGT